MFHPRAILELHHLVLGVIQGHNLEAIQDNLEAIQDNLEAIRDNLGLKVNILAWLGCIKLSIPYV